MFIAVLVLFLVAGVSMPPAQAVPAPASPESAQAEAAAQALLKAFTAGDVPAMSEHFAEKLLFIGDPQFLGESRGPQVHRDLTRAELAAAYTKLFDGMGRDRWTALVKQATPSVHRATANESHPEDTAGILPPDFAKAGDTVCEIRFRGSGLDDVLLFVLRPIDGKLKVVAHWADY